MQLLRSRALFAVLICVALPCACTAKKAAAVARPATNAKVDTADASKATPKLEPSVPPAQPAPQSDPPALDGDMPALLAKAEDTLRVLADRGLDEAQQEQRETGAAFLEQARSASSSGDADRALVLVNKCLLLLEDLEGRTR